VNTIENEIDRVVTLFNEGSFWESINQSNDLLKEYPLEKFLIKLQGACYLELNEFVLSEKKCLEYLTLDKEDPDIYNNLGILYHKQRKYDQSIKNFNKAISLNKYYVNAFNNLGCLYRDYGFFDKAIKAFSQGIEIDPNSVEMHQNLSHCLLLTGQLDLGLKEYNWRWQLKRIVENNFLLKSKKLWDGKQTNIRLLLWREQGLGDEIFFLNFLRNLKAKIKQIIVIVDRRLKTIYQKSFPEISFFIEQKNITRDDFDVHLPIGDLMQVLYANEDFLSYTNSRYLLSDVNRVKSFKSKAPLGKTVIGIAWKTLDERGNIDSKSVDIRYFGKLLENKNCLIVPLQYGNIRNELKILKNEFGLEIAEYSSIDRWADIDSLAALTDMCDLVISSSSSIVHLAGALNKYTWVFLPMVPSFWWSELKKDSVWYKSVKLYRQKKIETWEEPYYDMQSDLKDFFDNRT